MVGLNGWWRLFFSEKSLSEFFAACRTSLSGNLQHREWWVSLTWFTVFLVPSHWPDRERAGGRGGRDCRPAGPPSSDPFASHRTNPPLHPQPSSQPYWLVLRVGRPALGAWNKVSSGVARQLWAARSMARWQEGALDCVSLRVLEERRLKWEAGTGVVGGSKSRLLWACDSSLSIREEGAQTDLEHESLIIPVYLSSWDPIAFRKNCNSLVYNNNSFKKLHACTVAVHKHEQVHRVQLNIYTDCFLLLQLGLSWSDISIGYWSNINQKNRCWTLSDFI